MKSHTFGQPPKHGSEIVGCLTALFIIGANAAIIWVCCHFIAKYW
jgi:hypothetical protein